MPRKPTLDELRRHAVARTLRAPVSLPRAIERLGFVQADPIRAPARAQDLMLRLRVRDYRAGDLERRYPRLAVEEDFLVNYGFVPRALHHLMHPRTARQSWTAARCAQAQAVLDFVRERGAVHPKEVDAAFAHGRSRNGFGGTGRASTELLDGMHYRGQLRVARREGGVRLYAVRESPPPATDPRSALDHLVDRLVALYAPLPLRSLGGLGLLLRGGVPQWAAAIPAAIERARQRLPNAECEGQTWLWPAGEDPASRRWDDAGDERVRLLAPFDPLVWDRRRFEILWGWPYRFEAYLPPARRLRGHYALPLLWRDRVIGWGNLSHDGRSLAADIGYVGGHAPRSRGHARALEAELESMQVFLSPRK